MIGADVNVLEVQIRAQVEQFIQGLKSAASATGAAGDEMRGSLGSIGEGAQEATKHFDGLTGSLKEWRTHVRTEARYMNFMAAQVAGLGIASKGAAAEITGLISGFAFGGGFGVAIEGAKLLAHHIGEIGKSQKEANDTIRQYGVDAAKSIKTVTEQNDKMLMALRHASTQEVLRHDIIEPLLKDEQDKKNELIAVTDKLAVARASASYAVESEKELEAALSNETDAVRKATAAYEDARAKR